jgi:pSer/pThr/pTyr-binding forkhead associated (FHA) protein
MTRSPNGITLRVIDGADRGRVYRNLACPITIGREEGNSVQLNDERVSRFHLKIQEDQERIVLTDLDSTNGTRVNGEDTQLKILRFGDVILVGRSSLVYGTREQVADRLLKLKENVKEENLTLEPSSASHGSNKDDSKFDVSYQNDPDKQGILRSLEPMELPDRLSPVQAAQLTELLETFQVRLRAIFQAATVEREGEVVHIQAEPWFRMVELQAQLAELIRKLAEPR